MEHKSNIMKISLSLAILFFSSYCFAATYQVGSTRTYKSPNELYLANILEDFDTIEIDAETYSGTDALAVWEANSLTIVSVGGRAAMNADDEYIFGKGIWVLSGNFITVDGIEFYGATVPDKNGAGIRLDGLGMTIRNCFFHDNENGILTTNVGGGEILIEHSEFANNGFGDGLSHNVYIGTCDKLTFQFNYSHGAKVGHNLKSRAHVNIIQYNRIIDGVNGNSSRLIDISNGGFANIKGNVLVQGANAENGNLIGYALEGNNNVTPSELYLINNTMVNNREAGALFLDAPDNNTVFVQMINNIFGGDGDLIQLNKDDYLDLNNVREQDISLFDFVDETNFDYRIKENSIAIDVGLSLFVNLAGLDLVADYVYVHPTSFAVRLSGLANTVDAGAYEAIQISSTEDIGDDKEILTYPNPVYNVLNLPEVNFDISDIALYDAQGRLIEKIQSENGKVDVSHLPSGVYTLVFKTGDGEIVTNKIIMP